MKEDMKLVVLEKMKQRLDGSRWFAVATSDEKSGKKKREENGKMLNKQKARIRKALTRANIDQ
mgnify:CR=1 FL=1